MFGDQMANCRQTCPEGGHLATLGAGKIFCKLGLLNDSARTAQVRAESDCKMAVLYREAFHSLMEGLQRIARENSRQLLRHLGLELQEIGSKVGNQRSGKSFSLASHSTLNLIGYQNISSLSYRDRPVKMDE